MCKHYIFRCSEIIYHAYLLYFNDLQKAAILDGTEQNKAIPRIFIACFGSIPILILCVSSNDCNTADFIFTYLSVPDQ